MKCSSSIFKENHVFIEEKDSTFDQIVIIEEKLDYIGNLVD